MTVERLDNHTEIREVYYNQNEDGSYKDIFDSVNEIKSDTEYGVGYIVFDTEIDAIPDGCNDINFSIEEARQDYMNNMEVGNYERYIS